MKVVFISSTNDIELAPGGNPTYIANYSPVNIHTISLGIINNYLYMIIGFAGTLPEFPVEFF